ncbi:MAG: ferritin family protein [Candidatus Ratteibacteria bacterium]|jgi:rubrerythrin
MANLFDIREMLKMAVREEQTGYDYYLFLSQNARAEEVRKLAERLAGMEQYHEKLFTGLLDSLEDYQPVENYPGEYESYLNALMEGRMFPEENRAEFMIEAAKKDDRAAINIALMFERSTLFLFREVETFVPGKDLKTQEIIKKIIAEEKQHLIDLSIMKNKLR